MKKKIILVSYSFPPLNSIASRRWAEMIPYLLDDFDLKIFSGNYDGNLEAPIDERSIIRYGKHASLSKKGDTGNSLKGQILHSLRKGLRTIDSRIISFYYNNRKDFDKQIKEFEPDFIITSVGPFASSLFGLRAKRAYKSVKWIVDFRDSMSLYPYYKKNFLKEKIDHWFDRFIVKKSDLILTVSNTLAELLGQFYDLETHVIYNGFEESNTHSRETTMFDKRVIFFGGTVYEHQIPAFTILCDAISKGKRKFEILIRLVNVDIKDQLEAIAERKGVDLNIQPPVSNDIYLKEAHSAYLLLILENIDYQYKITKGTLTGKLFNYLPMKPPILSVCRKDSEIGKILDFTNRGIVSDDQEEISEFINSDKVHSFSGNKNVTLFSRKNQTEKLVEILDGL